MFDSGITIIRGLQQFSPALDIFFKTLTFLGDEAFFLAALPLIYWCLCKRTGARLSVLFLLSAYLNMVAKLAADMPRPFEYSPDVQTLVTATGGGFPSGHTQGAVVFWGYLATTNKSILFRALSGCLIVGIPLSRVYLGVHFPVDILGGYLFGTVLLLAFIKAETRFPAWRRKVGFSGLLLAAGLIPALLATLMASDKTAVAAMGALAGLGVGYVLENRTIGFAPPVGRRTQAAAFALGMVFLGVLYMGLKMGFAELEPQAVFRFVRYGLVGLWGGLGGPWLFIKLKWSRYENDR